MRDRSIRDSVFIMDLLNTIRPGVVNWELVHGIDTPEDRLHNARYVLSVACKLGCNVYLLPEDIVEVNRKMVLTLFAALMTLDVKAQARKKHYEERRKAKKAAAEAAVAVAAST